MKTIAVAAGIMVVAILAGVGISALRRRRADDVHSVEGYRSTLQTLEGLGARPVATRPLRDVPQSAERRRVGGTPSPADRRDAGAPLVFDDATGRDRLVGSLAGRGGDLGAMERRPLRYGVPVAVGVVVAAVIAAGVLVLLLRHHAPKAVAGNHSRTTTTQAPVPTTTLPTRYNPATSTPNSATYQLATTTYSMDLAATTGPCWVDVRSASGSTVFTQTLTAGTTKTIAMSGAATIDVGAPSALTVSIDRIAVVFPAHLQAPFTITLTQSAPGTG